MTTQENTTKASHPKGQFCGYFKGNAVHYSRPHFCLYGPGGGFIRHLSQQQAKKHGLTEDPGRNSAKIYNETGYIGPARHKKAAI